MRIGGGHAAGGRFLVEPTRESVALYIRAPRSDKCRIFVAKRSRLSIVNARDLDRYKRLLLAKLDELSATRDGTESLVPGAGGWQGDLVDQASSDTEAELQVRVHQADAHLLRAIEEALARIRRGTFGVCEVCARAISKARLEAVPWTRLCRGCKERQVA